jgi:hypothetical protein
MMGQEFGESGNRGISGCANRRYIANVGLHTNQPSRFSTFQSSNIHIVIRWSLLAGLLLAALGASFAPWVDRSPAALVLTAPDLAEFVKFLPEVRDGSLRVHRLLFLAPLLVATFSLALVVTSRQLTYPHWARWPVLILVIPLALTLLPPVWSPSVLLSTEFRLQTVVCLLCLGLIVISRWLRDIPTRPLLLLMALASLIAPFLILWQFYAVREAIASTYASAIVPGWGTWLTLTGFTLVILSALLLAHTTDKTATN